MENDPFKKTVWSREIANYVTRRDQLKQSKRAVSSVIMGQCTEAMKAKLKSHTDFDDRHDKADCVWLLTTIRAIMLKFEGNEYRYMGLLDAHAAITAHRQGNNTLTVYREELAVLVEAYEAYGGEYGRSESLMKLADELSDTLGDELLWYCCCP